MARLARFAIDRDGQNGLVVNGKTFNAGYGRPHDRLAEVVRTLGDGSHDLISAYWAYGNGNFYRDAIDSVPKRYDTRNGRLSDLIDGNVPHGVQHWIVDAQGVVRGGLAKDKGDTVLMVPGTSGQWVERARFPTFGSSSERFSMNEVATDGQVYVQKDTGDAAGSRGLFRLDLATGKVDPQPLLSAKGFDINAELIEDTRTHKVLGAHYVTDAPATVWFDARMKEVQAKIDARLPGLVNRIDVASCGCAHRVLVTSSSDRQSAVYFLYDMSDDSMVLIGKSRPTVPAAQMAVTDFYRVKARDGHDIPVYVTRPQGKGPWPTVVLVHGGAWSRGWNWSWDSDSQFLASRGYLVVKPEFRGSSGYGQRLFESGLRQWGLAVQDDIADATTWAASTGLEDPRRTCILGGDFGGYAVLMGLVRYPELYRCGVAFAAITDINLMYDIDWSDMSTEYRAYGMPLLIGDRVKDSEQLNATSPLQNAARIKRPLLLAHGGLDQRIPIEHATKLRNALEGLHAPLTWIEYKDEGHGIYKPDTRAEFYRQVEKFLAANMRIDDPAPGQ